MTTDMIEARKRKMVNRPKWSAYLPVLVAYLGWGCGNGTEPGNDSAVLAVELPGGASMEFVRVDSGVFEMGSPVTEPARDADEGPRHEVRISRPFYLGRTEITQAQWEAVMETRPWAGQPFVMGGPDYPAVHIAWSDVQAFAERLNAWAGKPVYRLPTEAEWEYACRAGIDGRWSFGEDERALDEYAWHSGNTWDAGQQQAQAVALKKPNPWGLYDMYGNVSEWVQDWYDETYYSRSPQVDPPGPDAGSFRVFRGGYFHNDGARRLRSANRMYYKPDARAASVGSRVLREIP